MTRLLGSVLAVALLLASCGGEGATEPGTNEAIGNSTTLANPTTEPTTTTTSTTTSTTLPTTTTEPPTTTTLPLLSDQDWPDPIYATEGPIIVWREFISDFMRLTENDYASNPGFPPKHWLPEETSIAPVLMEDALYMCDELTKGRQSDDIFMDIIRNRKDYPWPEANFQTFKLMMFSLVGGAIQPVGGDDSFCPEHKDTLADFLASQGEAISNVDSPHYLEFANCTPEKGCEKWKDGRPQEYS